MTLVEYFQMPELHLLLEYESGTTKNHTVQIKCNAFQNIFNQIEIFHDRPLRISFQENKFERSFVPTSMTFVEEQTNDDQSITKIIQEARTVASFDFNTPENPLKVFVFDEHECLYPGFVNRPIDRLKYSDDFNMNIYLKFKDESSSKDARVEYVHVSFSQWKDKLAVYEKSGGKLFLHQIEKDAPILVHLATRPGSSEPVAPIDRLVPNDQSADLIPVTSFMTFTIVGFKPPNAGDEKFVVHERIQALGSSFVHGLTAVGQRVFDRLKDSIRIRYSGRKNFIASLASICQHSGSGKSKLAYELTKRSPGVNIVLRDDNEDAFPKANNLSAYLYELIRNSDNVDSAIDLTEVPATESSKVATILNFLASLLMAYLQELLEKACVYVLKSDSYADAISKACAESGPQVATTQAKVNEKYGNYKLTDPGFSDMSKHYEKAFMKLDPNDPKKCLMIKDIAKFIDSLLKDPAGYLKRPDEIDDQRFIDLCTSLKSTLAQFPFMLVLDEAHLLANISRRVKFDSQDKDDTRFYDVNGFQLFRRALAYLNRDTPLFVLALGTKSVIMDLNPPHLDSYRASELKNYMPPIMHSGNFDIFSNEEGFRAVDFVPTYKILRNPLVFKLLVSLGSPVWSSLMLDTVIDIAVIKLKNSTVAQNEDLFVSWLIRTGMMTNPKAGTSEQLVAKRMACMFNLASDLNTMSVFYPPQPVLGIAARRICNEPGQKKLLFKSLLNNSSLIDCDRGELAENMSSMTDLLAIDMSDNVSIPCRTQEQYDVCLNDIIERCPKLENLWRIEKFILESEQQGTTSIINYNLYYHVTTVEKYLVNKYGNEIKNYLKSFPETTLKGLVNASHMVKLPGLAVFDDNLAEAYPLPVPNNLKNNESRHQIDRSLLQYGLTRQCGFLMPSKYYGIDSIIPVCLEDDTYTFIAIQTKTDERIGMDDAKKLQARLHYINCPRADAHDTNEPQEGCPHCVSSNGLDSIFGNQIGLLVSFGDPYVEERLYNTLDLFASDSKKTTLEETLSELYESRSVELFKQPDYYAHEPPSKLNEPRITHQLEVDNSMRIFNFLWQDSTVNLPKDTTDLVIKLGKRKTLEKRILKARKSETEADESAKRQRMSERKFSITDRKQRLFTISSDGWQVFSHLFSEDGSSDPLDDAVKVLNSRRRLFGDTSTVEVPNMIAAMLTESFIPDYNETIMQWRGIHLTEQQSKERFERIVKIAKSKLNLRPELTGSYPKNDPNSNNNV